MDMKIGNRLLEGSCVIHMLRCCHETVNGTRFVVCVCVWVCVFGLLLRFYPLLVVVVVVFLYIFFCVFRWQKCCK